MKRFLLRCLSWLLLLFFLEAVMYVTGFRFPSYNGKEVFQAIQNSKEKSGKRLLIIGDSVCNQLYPSDEEYPDAVSVACNQAVSMAGHFFLMNNYFEANKDSLPEQVVVIMLPVSLQNDLDRYAFHYFLKPFFKKAYKPFFQEALWRRVKMIPHYRFSRLPFVRISNYTFSCDLEPEDGYDLLSPVSRIYLKEMERLASSHGVELTLLCSPARKSRETEFLSLIEKGQAELDSTQLSSYRNSIVLYPDSLFVDEIHFIKKMIPRDPFGLLE